MIRMNQGIESVERYMEKKKWFFRLMELRERKEEI